MNLLLTPLLFYALQDPASPAPEPVRDLGLVACIRATLEQDPQIRISAQNTVVAEAQLAARGGAFDLTLDASTAVGRSVSASENGNQVSESTAATGGVSKLFRSGLDLRGTLSMNRNDARNVGRPAANSASVNLSLTYPLLQGRGRALTEADERTAEIGLQAALLDLRHFTSRRVSAVVDAYWDYHDAHEALTVQMQSEQQAIRLMEETKRLIEADEVPANDLLQLRANVADKRATRVSAENTVETTRQTLGEIMGLPYARTYDLPAPTDPFPDWDVMAPPERDDLPRLIEGALARRADLRAARLRLTASELDVRVARDGLRPDLSLTVETGYVTADTGSDFDRFAGIPVHDPAGPNYTARLRYRFTPGNHAAKGNLAIAASNLDRGTLQKQDLERAVASAVTQAVLDLRRQYEELVAVRESVALYELALANERKKLRLGFSTLLDVISYEDRLTAARLNYNNGRTRFVKSLVRLRFETATLLREDAAGDTLDPETLMQLP